MDYCVNIMLTVSYDRPISFIHTHHKHTHTTHTPHTHTPHTTHTHTHHTHTHTPHTHSHTPHTHTHTPTHHTHTHTHHTHTHTLTHTTHTLTHTTHTYTSNDYFSYTRTHERTNARTHARGSCMHNQDGSVVALTMVGAGRSEVRFLLKNVQIVSGTHSASYAMGTGVLYWQVWGQSGWVVS